MDIGFAEALLLLGLLLVIAAALSGWLHGTVLSISVLSVVAENEDVLMFDLEVQELIQLGMVIADAARLRLTRLGHATLGLIERLDVAEPALDAERRNS
jgi:hypothetical protein